MFPRWYLSEFLAEKPNRNTIRDNKLMVYGILIGILSEYAQIHRMYDCNHYCHLRNHKTFIYADSCSLDLKRVWVEPLLIASFNLWLSFGALS